MVLPSLNPVDVFPGLLYPPTSGTLMASLLTYCENATPSEAEKRVMRKAFVRLVSILSTENGCVYAPFALYVGEQICSCAHNKQ